MSKVYIPCEITLDEEVDICRHCSREVVLSNTENKGEIVWCCPNGDTYTIHLEDWESSFSFENVSILALRALLERAGIC